LNDAINALGFSGSLRSGSYNTALLRFAREAAPAGMNIDIFDISAIPLYNADVDAAGAPEPVARFKDAIAAHDALLIVTPEYNYSIPGVLKNAIDWASRPAGRTPLDGKPAAIMGASTGPVGTARAQAHLRLVLASNNVAVLPAPAVLVARAAEKFDRDGKLVDDATAAHVSKALAAFLDWTRRLARPAPQS